jgi:3-oxoacyl-[acyl-carrier protein] reductase
MFDLSGKTALVTGASGGLGAAIARTLHGAGAKVTLSGTRRPALDALAEELGPRAFVAAADLADPVATDGLVKAAEEAAGAVDILVNNAGLTRDQLALRMKDEDWQKVIDVDLTAGFRLARAAMRGMMKRRWGRIIGITSVVGVTGNPGQANYAAAKAGITGLTKTLAKEWGRYNVTVNTVAFGLIKTRLTQAPADGNATIDVQGREIKVGVNPQMLAAMEQMIPLGRAGTPAEAAGAVYLLCVPESDYVSAQTLICGGGFFI